MGTWETGDRSVDSLYGWVLGRQGDQGGLDYWKGQFGDTVDDNELSIFGQAAIPELSTNTPSWMGNGTIRTGDGYYNQNTRTGYNPTYTNVLDGYGAEGGNMRSELSGYRSYSLQDGMTGPTGNDKTRFNGTQYTDYGLEGNQTGTGTYSDITNRNHGMEIAKIFAAAAGMAGAQSLGLVGGTNPVLGDPVTGLANQGYGIVGGATEPVGSLFGDGLNGGYGIAGGATEPITDLGGVTDFSGGGYGAGGATEPITDAGGVTDTSGPGGYGDGGGASEPITDPGGITDTTPITPTPPTTPTPDIPTVPKPPVVPTPPGNNGTGGMTITDLLSLITGGVDAKRQGDASKDMLDFLKSRLAITDNLYQPGSAEYNTLWDSMSRKDAAAGRNSQYGPRSVDLASKIAQIKSSENTRMTQGIGALYKDSIDQNASKYSGLEAALGKLGKDGGGIAGITGATSLIDLINQIGKNGGNLTDWIGNLFKE
jgi:hypothetical protein